jgi:DNA-binding CsgD family transcriptional regulator
MHDAGMGAAMEALTTGDIDTAIVHLSNVLAAGELPEARVLLGGLCYFDDDFAEARRQWEAAFQGFRARGDCRQAARSAADLAELHWSALGNRAASRGWSRRARRLLAGEGRCPEQGYVALALVACEWTDVDALEEETARALELALEFGDASLEARALADSGYALVAQGRSEEGFGRLDEAMATIAAGEVHDLGLAAKSFCAMLSACDRAGATARAEEWTRLMSELLLDRFGGRPRILHTHCRLALGSVLCTAGRWPEGEAALLDALDDSHTKSLMHRATASARVAQLRVLQGRLAEAEELLTPYEDRLIACAPLAMLHLARGEDDLTVAAVQRGLDQLVGDRLLEAELLAVLVQAELGRDVDRAATAADRLATVAAACDTPVLRAEAALAAGRVALARAEPVEAADLLARARRLLGDDERHALCATIHFERASALAAAGDVAGAVSEARCAMTIFERLGAQPDVDRTAALLRSLGAPGRPGAADRRQAVASLTPRELDVLDLVRQGLTNAEIGGRLFISPKTVEHHVGRVLAKLGVRSRAEAAAVAASTLTTG